MPKICIFSRTSTTQQDVVQQTNVLIDEATRLGYSKNNQIIVEYQESATKLDIETRQGIQKLKETIINDSSIDTMICWELTRIARRADVIYNIRDFLLEHKVRWIILKPSYMELIDKQGQLTPTMSLMLGIFTSFAESEMMVKSERFKRAKNEMRQNGQKFAGAVIFGYMKDENKKCVPHPLHSKIVAAIFERYANTDASTNETYQWISAQYPEVLPYREYKKASHKIESMLKVEVYHKGNWCYPPLVSQEMYDIVRAKMDNARCKPRYRNTRDLLCRGKIFCAECGKRMTPSGGNTHAYICPTDKKHRLQLGFDIADYIMWEETSSILRINSAIDMKSKIREIEDMIKVKENIVYKCESEIYKRESQMEKLLDIYMKGIIHIEQFEKKMEELKNDKMTLEAEKSKNNSYVNELRVSLENVQKDLMNPTNINIDAINDFEARLEFVRKYIDKMIVEKDKSLYRTFYIKFEYTRPLITTRSTYKYVCHNQKNKKLYRVNEDNTEDLIL